METRDALLRWEQDYRLGASSELLKRFERVLILTFKQNRQRLLFAARQGSRKNLGASLLEEAELLSLFCRCVSTSLTDFDSLVVALPSETRFELLQREFAYETSSCRDIGTLFRDRSSATMILASMTRLPEFQRFAESCVAPVIESVRRGGDITPEGYLDHLFSLLQRHDCPVVVTKTFQAIQNGSIRRNDNRSARFFVMSIFFLRFLNPMLLAPREDLDGAQRQKILALSKAMQVLANEDSPQLDPLMELLVTPRRSRSSSSALAFSQLQFLDRCSDVGDVAEEILQSAVPEALLDDDSLSQDQRMLLLLRLAEKRRDTSTSTSVADEEEETSVSLTCSLDVSVSEASKTTSSLPSNKSASAKRKTVIRVDFGAIRPAVTFRTVLSPQDEISRVLRKRFGRRYGLKEVRQAGGKTLVSLEEWSDCAPPSTAFSVLEGLRWPMVVTDCVGVTIFANRAAWEAFGLRSDPEGQFIVNFAPVPTFDFVDELPEPPTAAFSVRVTQISKLTLAVWTFVGEKLIKV